MAEGLFSSTWRRREKRFARSQPGSGARTSLGSVPACEDACEQCVVQCVHSLAGDLSMRASSASFGAFTLAGELSAVAGTLSLLLAAAKGPNRNPGPGPDPDPGPKPDPDANPDPDPDP